MEFWSIKMTYQHTFLELQAGHWGSSCNLLPKLPRLARLTDIKLISRAVMLARPGRLPIHILLCAEMIRPLGKRTGVREGVRVCSELDLPLERP